jgi:hypothetical protein
MACPITSGSMLDRHAPPRRTPLQRRRPRGGPRCRAWAAASPRGTHDRTRGLGACCSPPRARSSSGKLTSYGDGVAGGRCVALRRSAALLAKRRPPRRCAASNARAMRPSRRIRSRCPALSIITSRSRLVGESGIRTSKSKVYYRVASMPLSLPQAYRACAPVEGRRGVTVADSDELPGAGSRSSGAARAATLPLAGRSSCSARALGARGEPASDVTHCLERRLRLTFSRAEWSPLAGCRCR